MADTLCAPAGVHSLRPLLNEGFHGRRSLRPKPTILAAFANAPAYGGGMKIAPQAQLDDGKLDVCIVRAMNRVQTVLSFPDGVFRKAPGLSRSRVFAD